MAGSVGLKYALKIIGITALILNGCRVSIGKEVACAPQLKEFNTTIQGYVSDEYRACYKFSYDFHTNQKWTPKICVSSPEANKYEPVLVSVRESLNIMSFEVPYTHSTHTSFSQVCHTLCPLENYYDKAPSPGQQWIYISLSTASKTRVAFSMTFSTIENFILVKNQDLHINITPSEPFVLEYNMEPKVSAVRFEANSADNSCTLLGIQDLKCPFYDTETTIAYSGSYQTFTTQTGVHITRDAYEGRMYIVLILLPSDDKCKRNDIHTDNTFKEITLRFSPTITDSEKAWGIIIVLVIYGIVWIIGLYIMCDWRKCIYNEKEKNDLRKRCHSSPLMNQPNTDDIIPLLKLESKDENTQKLLAEFQKVIAARDFVFSNNYFLWRTIRNSMIKSLQKNALCPDDAPTQEDVFIHPMLDVSTPQTQGEIPAPSPQGDASMHSTQDVSAHPEQPPPHGGIPATPHTIIQMEPVVQRDVTRQSESDNVALIQRSEASPENFAVFQQVILQAAVACAKMDFPKSKTEEEDTPQEKIIELLNQYRKPLKIQLRQIEKISSKLETLWRIVEKEERDGEDLSNLFAESLEIIRQTATKYSEMDFFELPEALTPQREISKLLKENPEVNWQESRVEKAFKILEHIASILGLMQGNEQQEKIKKKCIAEFDTSYQEMIIETTKMYQKINFCAVSLEAESIQKEVSDLIKEYHEMMMQSGSRSNNARKIIEDISTTLASQWKKLGKESYFEEKTLAGKNQQKSKVYLWDLLVVAVFYVIPAFQVVTINLKNIYLTGNQDLCYYNNLCSHKAGYLFDFNHVYSNSGYVFLGLLFIFIVHKRKGYTSEEQKFLDPYQAKGPYIHFGIQYAMGAALCFEGLLSLCYHICPNEQDFQFDLTFMYVISVLCMMSLHQGRHHTILDKPHGTFLLLGGIIILCVLGTFFGNLTPKVYEAFFWIFFIVHLVVIAILCLKVYFKYNTSKVSVFRQLFNALNECSEIKAKHWGRIAGLIFVWLLNFTLEIADYIYFKKNLGERLLFILLMNTCLYYCYYIALKCYYQESYCWYYIKYLTRRCCRRETDELPPKLACQSGSKCSRVYLAAKPLIYTAIFIATAVPALMYFVSNRATWTKTPAESREHNIQCIEWTFNFYDDHDMWHFLSSFAVFFLFLIIITIDDDISNVPRKYIALF